MFVGDTTVVFRKKARIPQWERTIDSHYFQVRCIGFAADVCRLLIIMEWTPNSEALQNLAGILSISSRSSSAAVSSSYDVRFVGSEMRGLATGAGETQP